MFKEVNFNDYSKEALEQINNGAFLTVKSGDEVNTMTIGWGNIGVIWSMPIFTVAVRYSRHTYNLLENSDEFTVSIPIKVDMKKELAFCGTKSGRDVNKFKECNLKLKDGIKVGTPIIENCELHYECKIVYKQAREPGTLDDIIKEKYYTNNDYHILYYGKIVNCYIKE